ncbi:MAG: hypothetical protein A4E61_01593 [Syntrophorhabdus sp. PtaB.Bin184]|nr:MAG: hypothetical protein A4E61_01593 [Syntrophorhabdus sp. PtaB.Bin184]
MAKITVEQITEAIESGEYIGFCLGCGAEAYGVEPDARRYTCEECGAKKVYGAEELLFMTVG